MRGFAEVVERDFLSQHGTGNASVRYEQFFLQRHEICEFVKIPNICENQNPSIYDSNLLYHFYVLRTNKSVKKSNSRSVYGICIY